MNSQEVEKNIRLYKWFIVLVQPLFWAPTIILYIQNVGKMDLPSIYFMEAIVLAGCILITEIPSGALADIIGRKKTLFLASILMLIGVIWTSFIRSPIDVWISNVFCMIAFSVIHGADSSLLFDSLKQVNREKEFIKIRGQAMGNIYLTVAFCSLLAGFLSEINIRIPFILSIPGILISCFLALKFKEPIIAQKYSFKKQNNLIKLSILLVANNKKIKWIISFSILILVSSKIWFFTYNPYFEEVELSLFYYGIIFFLLNIIAWFFSKNAHFFAEKVNERLCATTIVLFIGLPIFLMGSFISKIMVSMVFFQNIVRGFLSPFLEEMLNQHLTQEKRATVFSIKSVAVGIGQIIGLYSFGIILNFWSLGRSLQILGILVLFFGFLLIIKYKKIFKPLA